MRGDLCRTDIVVVISNTNGKRRQMRVDSIRELSRTLLPRNSNNDLAEEEEEEEEEEPLPLLPKANQYRTKTKTCSITC